MKTFFKIVAWGVGGIFALVAGAAVIAPMVVDPNDFKDDITARVKEQTGRELRIPGDIKLKVFPDLGVDLGTVELANAPGFDAPLFARLERMQVQLKLLPLLSRQLEMGTITVDGLSLHLAKNAAGATNWDDLVKTKNAGGTTQPVNGQAGPPAIAGLAVGGLMVNNAAVTWNDATAGQLIKVQNLRVETGEVSPPRPIELSVEFDVEGLGPGIGGHVATSALASLDLGANSYTLSNIAIKADLTGDALPGGKASVSAGAREGTLGVVSQDLRVSGLAVETKGLALEGIGGDIRASGDLSGNLGTQQFNLADLKVDASLSGAALDGGSLVAAITGALATDLTAQTVAIQGLTADVSKLSMPGLDANVKITGNVSGQLAENRFAVKGLAVNGRASGERLSGAAVEYALAADIAADLASGQFAADGLSLTGTATGDKVPGGSMPFELAADAAFDGKTAKLTGFRLNAAQMKGSGDLLVTEIGPNPKVEGKLALADFNPRLLAKIAGQALPPTSDPKAFTRASLSATISGTGNGVKLAPLALALDDSKLTGTLQASNFAAKVPSVAFDLALDTINANRYAAPAAKGKPPAPAVPVDLLRSLDVDGRLRVGALQTSGIKLANVDLGIKAKQGLVDVTPLKASLYEGNYSGHIVVDARKDALTLSLDEKIIGIRADRLLADLGIKPGVDLSGGKSAISIRTTASGDLAAQQLRLAGLSVTADLAGKDFPGGRLDFGFGADVDLGLKSQALEAKGYKLRFAGATATGDLSVRNFLGAPTYTVRVAVDNANPRAVLAAIGQPPIKTADPRALASFSVSTLAQGSTNSIKLDPLKLTVDATNVTGKIDVKDLKTLSSSFSLDVDAIDADRYLPPSAGKKGAAGTPGAAATLVPVELLRNLDLDGALRIGRIKINNIKLNNIVVTAKARDGVATLSPLNAELYSGKYNGNIQIDARKQVPILSVNEQLAGVQAGPLLKDLGGKAPVTGTASFSAKMTGVATNERTLRESLQGVASFNFKDGTIEGVDVLRSLCTLLGGLGAAGGGGGLEALLQGALSQVAAQAAGGSAGMAGGTTRFAELKGTVNCANARCTNNDLSVRSPALRIAGDGGINLKDMYVDYLAKPSLVSSCEGQGGRDFRELAGIELPVQLKGHYPNIEPKPKLSKLVFQAISKGNPAPAPTAQPQLPQLPKLPGQQQTQQQQQQQQAPPRPTKPEDIAKDAVKQILKGGGLGGLFGN